MNEHILIALWVFALFTQSLTLFTVIKLDILSLAWNFSLSGLVLSLIYLQANYERGYLR